MIRLTKAVVKGKVRVRRLASPVRPTEACREPGVVTDTEPHVVFLRLEDIGNG